MLMGVDINCMVWNVRNITKYRGHFKADISHYFVEFLEK